MTGGKEAFFTFCRYTRRPAMYKKEHIKHSMKSTAPADCVTEIRIGNSVLVVSGFFKQSATETAADKMAKVLEAEAATQKSAI